jgi:hypothetical protein
MSDSSSGRSIFSIVCTRESLDALVAIPDLLFDDHGQSVLDDGTLSLAAYATDAAAAAAASQAGVTVTLIATSDEIASWWDEGGGVA